MPWDDGLAPESAVYAIAAADARRVRVLAGPGTGKSFAMKRRVARLLEVGVPPERILPVTFTKVAAEDLHRELVQMDVEGAGALQATTLHSLALRRLMRAHVLAATGRIPRPLNDFEKSLSKETSRVILVEFARCGRGSRRTSLLGLDSNRTFPGFRMRTTSRSRQHYWDG